MEKPSTGRDAGCESAAPLPAERAFVVQLRAEADAAGDPFVGRAEHIASGAVAQFASAADLIAFIRRTVPSRRASSEREEA